MTPNWVGWMMSGIVVLLLFVVALMLKGPVLLGITGERTRGVVVGMSPPEPDSGARPAAARSVRAPVVEFVTATGERVRVSGRTATATPSAGMGDRVTVLYNAAEPHDAQLLLWKEFMPPAMMLGFATLIVMLWMAIILVSGDGTPSDPLHILPAIISHFRLNPVRFPLLFLLSVTLLGGLPATYGLVRHALELRTNGVKVVGHVVGSEQSYSRLSDRTVVKASYPTIAYQDSAGAAYTIRGGWAYPYSRLKPGDKVELIYLDRAPGDAIVHSWFDQYFPSLFFASMMIAFLVLLRLVLIRAPGLT